MTHAYNVLKNNDLLHEITKWHILSYINFPDIFLDIISSDININKLDWLLSESYITIDMLNTFVTKLVPYLYLFSKGGKKVYIDSFISYVLFYKKCPKIFIYIFNNFKTERDTLIDSKILELEETQKYLKQCFDGYYWLYNNKHVNVEQQIIVPEVELVNQYANLTLMSDLTDTDGHIFFKNTNGLEITEEESYQTYFNLPTFDPNKLNNVNILANLLRV